MSRRHPRYSIEALFTACVLMPLCIVVTLDCCPTFRLEPTGCQKWRKPRVFSRFGARCSSLCAICRRPGQSSEQSTQCQVRVLEERQCNPRLDPLKFSTWCPPTNRWGTLRSTASKQQSSDPAFAQQAPSPPPCFLRKLHRIAMVARSRVEPSTWTTTHCLTRPHVLDWTAGGPLPCSIPLETQPL
jgi:hypothetical protein